MCGIAGIINFNGQPVEKAELKLMTDAIRHRGPDGEGFFLKENIGLGHRRLAIIDLSAAAAQPMTLLGLTITYNGEIYNYLELRVELEALGFAFATHSDTEVILAAYYTWGTHCVQRFNGMWSFAIFDQARQRVFCSRDRFGEKPFYYTQQQGRFFFSSELKGLLSVCSKPAPNKASVARFLVFEQSEFESDTFFEGIQKLPAAHHLLVHLNDNRLELIPYYTPKQEDTWSRLHSAELAECLTGKLKQAVRLRMRSDVEVGTCLSGGLDSSTIASMAAPMAQSQQRFLAVTGGSFHAEKDERAMAEKVARHCGISWKSIAPEQMQFAELDRKIFEVQEEPFHSPSVYLQYRVMQLAQSEGLKVLLDGQGADELLMGYHQHLAWYLYALKPTTAIAVAARAMNAYQLSLKQLATLYLFHGNTGRKYQFHLNRWGHLNATVRQLLEADIYDEKAKPKDLFSLQVNELTHRILPMLLRFEDKNAMAHSIETRLPFLDKDVVAFLLNIPGTEKIKNGWSKHLLRSAMHNQLPNEVVWQRGKIGFDPGSIPLCTHWSKSFTHFLETDVLSGQAEKEFLEKGKAGWRMANLSKWFATYFE